MFNMIKMDMFRMFKSRSMLVIGIIFAVMTVSTSIMLKVVYEDENLSQIVEETKETQENDASVGMSINIVPGEEGKITILDEIYGNIGGMLLALFLVIFTVLYSSADYTSGYIKNIAGQVKNRSMLVFSKAICLFVYTVVLFIFYVAVQTISDTVVSGYFNLGNASKLFSYIGVQFILHYALALLVMCITLLIRNNLISMIIAVCLSLNVFTMIYGLFDKIVSNIGIKDFAVSEYTLTGNIVSLLPGFDAKDAVRCIITACVFGVAFLLIGSTVSRKRDVV